MFSKSVSWKMFVQDPEATDTQGIELVTGNEQPDFSEFAWFNEPSQTGITVVDVETGQEWVDNVAGLGGTITEVEII